MLGTVSRLFHAHFPLLCWLNFDFIWGVTVSGYMLASASSLKAHSVWVANDTHAGRSWERLCFLGGMEWMYLTKSFPLSHAFLPWMWTWCLDPQQPSANHEMTNMKQRSRDSQRCWPDATKLLNNSIMYLFPILHDPPPFILERIKHVHEV